MKQIKITADVYDAGELKFAAGVAYPDTVDARRQVALNNAVEVEAEPDASAEVQGDDAAEKPARGRRNAKAE